MENRRTCGGCTACCLTHQITEINKPAGRSCPYCTGTGCRIYDRKPQACTKFRCAWLFGVNIGGTGLGDIVDELERPDRIGVVLDYFPNIELLGKSLQIWEFRPGAISTPIVWEMTRSMLDRDACVAHMYLSGRQVLFVPERKTLSRQARRRISREGVEIASFPIVGIPVG